MKKTVLFCLFAGACVQLSAHNQDNNTPSYQENRNFNQSFARDDQNNANSSPAYSANDTQTDRKDIAGEDRRIEKHIRDYLKGAFLRKDYSGLNVTVLNGNVTLQGSVESADDRDAIEKNVRKMMGVKTLNNQLTVSDRVEYEKRK